MNILKRISNNETMQKYTLYTWPDSEEFIGNSLCFPVCPPDDEGSIHLDSSCMVPITIAEPAGAEKVYVKLDETESINWLDKTDDEDNVLFDFDNHAYVEESLYEASRKEKEHSGQGVEASFDVCIAPMTNVKVRVADPLHPTEEETKRIIETAVDAIQTGGDAYIIADNVESIEHYDPVTGKKTPVFNSAPDSIDQKVKAIMGLKSQIGEFSVDLYYNDWDRENPYTAKMHSVLNEDLSYHARAKSFNEALDMLVDYIHEKLQNLKDMQKKRLSEISG